MATPDLYWFYAFAAFLFGLLFGSFLNVCIYRLPRGLSVVSPRSACPSCHTPIAAFDNIPVISWLALRGRCRHCKTKISGRYAAVELLTGFLFLVCYTQFGGMTLATLKACVFSFLILGLIFTDAETHLLPDAMTLPGFAVGLVFSAFVPMNEILQRRFAMNSALAEWWQAPRFLSFADSLIGAAVGAGLIYAAAELYLRMRGMEGMGLGDVKLMAMVGAFLGLRLTLFVLFVASLAGALFGGFMVALIFRKRLARLQRMKVQKRAGRAWSSASLALRFYEMPFGVFLGGAALLAMFYGHRIIFWYFGLFT